MKYDRLTPLTPALVSLDDDAVVREVADFAAACPGATYLQEPDWPDFAPTGNGRFNYVLATVRNEAGTLQLAGLLRRTALPGGLALGAFRRGPLTRRVADLAPALSALLPVLKAEGYVSVTLNPRWYDADAEACAASLTDLGASEVDEARQTLHNCTGLVDLDRPLDAILTELTRTARQTVRKLEKSGLTVRTMTEADLDTYARWRAAFVADRGISVLGQPSVAAQLDHVRKKGGLAAMAELDGQDCGAFIGFRDGDRILPITDAWADPNARLPRGYLTLWAMIRAGHSQPGLRWLDLGGLSDQPRLIARDPDAAQRAAQRDDFKMRFCPVLVRMPRIHEFVLRPVLHRLAMTAKKKI